MCTKTDIYTFLQVYEIAGIDASSNCDHLYFKKQVYNWEKEYKVGDKVGMCQYSRPVTLNGNQWNHDSEKLARTSLMFADKLSLETPSQGIQTSWKDTSNFEPLWTSSNNLLTLPWRHDTGFRTYDTVFFRFGNPDRSAMIWGMVFMKEQFKQQFDTSFIVMIGYNYYKDVERGAYTSSDWR